VIAGGQRFEISTNLYPGAVDPEGYRYLTGFRLDPFPISTFEAGAVKLEKRVFMVQDENTVAVEYELIGGNECRLEVRPLLAFRGYHELTHANPALNGALKQSEGMFSIQPYPDQPEMFVAHNARAVDRRAHWYYHFEYPMERERGLDFQEDLFCACVMTYDLAPQKPAVAIASTVVHHASEAASLKTKEIERRQAASSNADPLVATLQSAAAQFIARRNSLHTVIAGYPWFTDWGRDTMVALPGLTLATGRFDLAREILLEFAGWIDQGLVPNWFPDAGGEPEYNTADATLWFFEAVRQYLAYSNDMEFVSRQLYAKLQEIIDCHMRGTRFGIHVDTDGLIIAKAGGVQLTWMDARVADRVVTPRAGKPVEIQALWYNALKLAAKLAGDRGDESARVSHEDLADEAGKSFNDVFWNEEAGCLYDVVDGDQRDRSLRPNQVIALSLGYCAIPEDRARKILAAAEQHLLTPFGLRTLAPFETGYRGRCTGPIPERDGAYHQGTVWPWLLGPFLAADARFNGETARARRKQLLEPLREFTLSRGVGQIPEIFDGDAPHEPRGCFAQAWSVAEVLRILQLAD
jgi:predicted glycogen debranching enzyme